MECAKQDHEEYCIGRKNKVRMKERMEKIQRMEDEKQSGEEIVGVCRGEQS